MTTTKSNQTGLPKVRSDSPLFDPQIERIVLGTILLTSNAAQYCIANIHKKEVFYDPINQRIFEAAKQAYEALGSVDLLIVVNQLRKNGVLDLIGGPYYISQLTDRIAGDSHLQAHVYLLKAFYVIRSFRDHAIHTQSKLESGTDPLEVQAVVNQWRKMVTKADAILNTTPQSTAKQLASEEVSDIKNDVKKKVRPGLSSGFPVLDKSGLLLYPGNMIILAARPGMGKSALAFQIAINIAEAGDKVHFYSYEMSKKQLIQRYMAFKTRIDSRKILQRKLTAEQIEALSNVVISENLVIIDDVKMTTEVMISKIKNMDASQRPKLIIIDYLQLMSSTYFKPGENREQEVSSISRSIKLAAKELDIPIIALSQLSRSVESRADKRPRLSDLRESGAIEQDADVIGFIYRKVYYDDTVVDKSEEHLAEILFEKNRHGSLMVVALKYLPKYTCFLEEETIDKQFNQDNFTAF